MSVKELLLRSIEIGNRMVLPMFEDLRDAPLERTLPDDGLHAHWILGHVLFSEIHMIRVFAMGESTPYEEFMESFKSGPFPDPEGKGYPPYDELLELFRQERERTSVVLKSLSEAELNSRPEVLPDGYEEFIPTKAACFLETSHHLFNHRGQLADIRRRLGREILLY